MNKHLQACSDHDPNNYDALVITTQIQFLVEANPEKALQTTQKARQYAGRDGTWRYNRAFLLMYLGDFDDARLCLRNASCLKKKTLAPKGQTDLSSRVLKK